MARVFKTYEEFAAAQKGGKVPPVSEGDPFAKHHRIGWWSNGEIVEYTDDEGNPKPLPTLINVDHLETARLRAREGWLPIEHVRDEVLDLLIAYHGGADKLPKALAPQLAGRLADRKKKPATS